jgi:hypothetical protein
METTWLWLQHARPPNQGFKFQRTLITRSILCLFHLSTELTHWLAFNLLCLSSKKKKKQPTLPIHVCKRTETSTTARLSAEAGSRRCPESSPGQPAAPFPPPAWRRHRPHQRRHHLAPLSFLAPSAERPAGQGINQTTLLLLYRESWEQDGRQLVWSVLATFNFLLCCCY